MLFQDLPGADSTKGLYLELLNDLNNLPSVASVQGTSTQVPSNGKNIEGLEQLQTLLIDLTSWTKFYRKQSRMSLWCIE